jgi:cytidylate kinase
MNIEPGFEKALSFINLQLQPPAQVGTRMRNGARRPAITISRQTGSGAHAIGDRLVEILQAEAAGEGCPWTIFDRNLVQKVLEDHHLPGRLERYMPEDRLSEFSDTLDEMFGLHPPSWTLVRKMSETVLHLAELGNVIIIGRGAHVVTGKLDHVFKVRLVGSVEARLKRIEASENLRHKEAIERVQREDRGRARYLKKYFGKDIDDPLLYHLVINTDFVSCAAAAKLIAQAVMQRQLAMA